MAWDTQLIQFIYSSYWGEPHTSNVVTVHCTYLCASIAYLRIYIMDMESLILRGYKSHVQHFTLQTWMGETTWQNTWLYWSNILCSIKTKPWWVEQHTLYLAKWSKCNRSWGDDTKLKRNTSKHLAQALFPMFTLQCLVGKASLIDFQLFCSCFV